MEVSTDFPKDHIQESVAARLIGARPPGEGNIPEVVDLGTKLEMTGSDTTFKASIVAGAAAGIMEHCVMYPVDCVKVILL